MRKQNHAKKHSINIFIQIHIYTNFHPIIAPESALHDSLWETVVVWNYFKSTTRYCLKFGEFASSRVVDFSGVPPSTENKHTKPSRDLKPEPNVAGYCNVPMNFIQFPKAAFIP